MHKKKTVTPQKIKAKVTLMSVSLSPLMGIMRENKKTGE